MGLFSQMVSDLGAAHLGIRKAGCREVMEAIRRPALVGRPLSVATDAQLGFSAIAYQLAEVLSGRCQGDGHFLARGLTRAAKKDT